MKEICYRYFFLAIGIFTFYSFYYSYENIQPLNYLFIICTGVHILWFYIPYKLNYESIRPLLPLYFSFISVALYLNGMYYWNMGQITAFIWFMIIPTVATLFYRPRAVLIWSVSILLLVSFSLLILPPLPKQLIVHLTNKQQFFVNISTIVLCLAVIFYFIYY